MVKERKMKAINFLQWFDLHYGINGMGRTMEGVQTVTLKMQMVADFYSQPFKPEMIAELFEGWASDGYQRYINTDDTDDKHFEFMICFEENCPDYYDLRINGEVLIQKEFDNWQKIPSEILQHVRPTTLDHFISDCERAGIELTFKSEIVEKYFK